MGIFRSKRKKWLSSLPSRVSSAALILEDSQGRALIVKANYKSYWTFPGGIVDPGETPKEAAIRETLEEVGIRIDSEKVDFVAVVDRKSTYADTYQFIFSSVLTPEAISMIELQASEIDEYALVSKKEVRATGREYGEVIRQWVEDKTGYIELIFNEAYFTKR